MNIYYISKIENTRMDRITAEGHGIMGSMDLLAPNGTPFPVFYLSLGFMEEIYDLSAQGRYVNANIIKDIYSEENIWNLSKDKIKIFPHDPPGSYLHKWLIEKTIHRDSSDNKYYFFFKDEKIMINTYNSLNFTKQTEDVVLDFSPHYERCDRYKPEFDVYFDNIEILGIADTPEELLILQAQQEGKTLTLEEAKVIAKDWHFGGLR